MSASEQPVVMTPEPSEDDVRRLRDWLISKGVKPTHEQDDDEDDTNVWFWFQRVVRYSRMKWDSDDAAFAALTAVLVDADDDECFLYTRMSLVVAAIFEAGADMKRHSKRRSS